MTIKSGATVVTGDRAFHRGIPPQRPQRVGTRNDHERWVLARVHGRANLLHHLIGGDNVFPRHRAATLRGDLILDVKGCDAGRLVPLHGVHHVDGVAIPCIRNGDDRHVDGRGNPARVRRHLLQAKQSDIRQTES